MKAIVNVVRKLSDLSTEAVGYTSGDSIESVVQQLSTLDGQILGAISASEFVVSVGSKDGLAKGDRLIVFSEVPVRNKKGAVIFKKRQETAKLEVTDVTSTSDRAMARSIPGTGTDEAGATQPQEGDPVKVDTERARTLRSGTPLAAQARADRTAQSATVDIPSANVEATLRKGDRFFEDKYYSQALEQYQKANELKPGTPAVLFRIANAHLMMKSFLELETLFEEMVNQGLVVPLQVSHTHAFQSPCIGVLMLDKGTLTYKPQAGDHQLTLTKANLSRIQVLNDGLQFKVRGSDGKDKGFKFVPLTFSQDEQRSFAAKVFVPTQPQATDQAVLDDQQKYLKLLARLYSRHLR